MIAYRIPNLCGINRECYYLVPPYDGKHDYVISSYTTTTNPPETLMFPANSAGQITDFCEIAGFREDYPVHLDVLKSIGYVLHEDDGSRITADFHD